ncbi:protein rep [Levilactobacillus brevis]
MTAHIINILHVLLFVRSSYFKSSDSYINQEEWTRLWQKALKDFKPSKLLFWKKQNNTRW